MTSVAQTPRTELLAHLPAVGLDELVGRAALMTRVDRKYIVSSTKLPNLIARLDGRVRVLDVAAQREFGYQSHYFDTPQLDSYLGGARRRRRRFKVRVRRYVDTDAMFVEVKTRGSRGATVKSRIPYAGSPYELDDAGRRYVGSVLAEAGVRCDLDALAPTLTSHYGRATLLADATDSRITIDSNVILATPSGRAMVLPDAVIVESKSARGASEIDRALWVLGHRPCSISKYGTGLAALRPELPANHWHSTLQRYFVDNTGKARHA